MIKVYVIKPTKGKIYYHQWVDPNTGKKVTRTSKLTQRREAERAAEKLEAQLNHTGRAADGSMPWDEFIELFQEQYLSGVAKKTRQQFEAILRRFAEHNKPLFLRNLNAVTLANQVSRLRGEKRAEDTIKSHMRHLKAVVRWAKDVDLIAEVPKIPKVVRAKKAGNLAKGRPLTDDEVERFAKAAWKAESSKHAPESWADLIRGLNVSGLRLGEALVLTWDNPDLISIDLTDPDWPKLRIPDEHEKGHTSRLHPITPDFADFLMARRKRTGYVFNALHTKGEPTRSISVASHTLSEIGEASGVMVDSKRFCTAHDLRRSFGFRMALKGMRQVVLKAMMRHKSILTTEKYYWGKDATQMQEEIYRLWGRKEKPVKTLVKTSKRKRKKP